MAYTWKSRKGDVYTLCEVETKRGTRYVFARKPRGTPLEEVPEGYEVRETVNGVVSIRKRRESPLNPLEVELVRRAVGNRKGLLGYRVDADGNRITIYEPRMDTDGISELGLPPSLVESALARIAVDPVLRFTLVDTDPRAFTAERWCFSGSIDDWIFVDYGGSLPALVKRLVPHLGQESFYELY